MTVCQCLPVHCGLLSPADTAMVEAETLARPLPASAAPAEPAKLTTSTSRLQASPLSSGVHGRSSVSDETSRRRSWLILLLRWPFLRSDSHAASELELESVPLPEARSRFGFAFAILGGFVVFTERLAGVGRAASHTQRWSPPAP
ncbi:hypothetical protein CC80DRAFT_545210 [Byssothecium circinans]|uniref:Uncharacterized protein n=1 Tax=Byssothecium circinans TaxID=147558 RepID=A0A6A5U3R2_9PLEO|nr:hypothetical protein CC80DRAFT_545210 [Byssothecium circinans]